MRNCLLAVGLTLALAACATTAAENDPSKGGFGNAVAGVLGGQYDERLHERKVEADRLALHNADLEARSNALKAERDQLSLEISKVRNRISQQNARIAELESRVRESSSMTDEERSRLARLSSRAADLRQHADRMDAYSTAKSASGVRDELAELEKESNALSSEFDMLASGVR
ncbi:hypothetical protein [Parvibaculum sp.]|uniref:hypothetical protein n=1 Tax=Parvibaculum sp. TaxID=2024848 RepID=UPI001DDA9AEE|nr:hypothetical protein [Parvibaculum sp.]MBX3489992.1 hypothetical protein [Parvibaculum sp.]MCW5726020.1 hypothetical protein [Parvibaculum sp.]